MKKTALTVFKVLISIVLIGKISNWVLDYSDETNQILNIAMFCLIGISYTVAGFLWDQSLIKAVLIACGLYLIAMNFFGEHMMLNIIGIICMLTPMLIIQFSPGETQDELLKK